MSDLENTSMAEAGPFFSTLTLVLIAAGGFGLFRLVPLLGPEYDPGLDRLYSIGRTAALLAADMSAAPAFSPVLSTAASRCCGKVWIWTGIMPTIQKSSSWKRNSWDPPAPGEMTAARNCRACGRPWPAVSKRAEAE